MQLLSFRKPYEMLPPVPEAQMLTHGRVNMKAL